jgi:hypothetical protein
MTLRIKNWEQFQHFKDRSPPWIKLYREILDDPDWHELDSDASKVLIMLWLVASEDKTQNGLLPETKKLAFRLRITEVKLNQSLNKLNNWLIQDDINVISEQCQDDAPETEERQSRERVRNQFLYEIEPQILADYLKVRKAKKAGEFTETSFKEIKKEALKAGLNINEALAYCCKRSWQGFEAGWYLKENPKKQSGVIL